MTTINPHIDFEDINGRKIYYVNVKMITREEAERFIKETIRKCKAKVSMTDKITGYKTLTQDKIDTINVFKEIEENILRDIEDAIKTASKADEDPRALQIAFTKFQEAFMWLTRGVANPSRIKLPEDSI